MSTPSITSSKCAVRIKVSQHDVHPSCLKNIFVEVKHSNHHGIFAELTALIIDRSRCDDFPAVMDQESDDLRKFSMAIFDDTGNIKRRFVDHEQHRGSGCWGEEMNQGMLVYMSDLSVEEQVSVSIRSCRNSICLTVL